VLHLSTSGPEFLVIAEFYDKMASWEHSVVKDSGLSPVSAKKRFWMHTFSYSDLGETMTSAGFGTTVCYAR